MTTVTTRNVTVWKGQLHAHCKLETARQFLSDVLSDLWGREAVGYRYVNRIALYLSSIASDFNKDAAKVRRQLHSTQLDCAVCETYNGILFKTNEFALQNLNKSDSIRRVWYWFSYSVHILRWPSH